MTSIGRERELLKQVGLCDYRLREDWGSRYNYTNDRNVIEPATRIFVHISVTNPNAYSLFDAHARAIESIGINRFPRTGISYNRLIMAGTLSVYEAQPMGRRGAHTVNDHERDICTRFGSACPGYRGPLTAPRWNLNYNTRAYCYASNTGFSFDDNSLDTMARAIAADKLAGLVTMDAKIHGHRDVAFKECPGDRVYNRLHELDNLVKFYVQGGQVAFDKNDLDTMVHTDGVIRAPHRWPNADENQWWTLESYVRIILNLLGQPRASDELPKLIIGAIKDLPKPPNYLDQLDRIEQMLVGLNQKAANLEDKYVELQLQNVRILDILDQIQVQYATAWDQLGDWDSITQSWYDTMKNDVTAAAKVGAKEALSDANLVVSWEKGQQ